MAYTRIEKIDADTAIGYRESQEQLDLKSLREEKRQIKARLAEINAVLVAIGETP